MVGMMYPTMRKTQNQKKSLIVSGTKISLKFHCEVFVNIHLYRIFILIKFLKHFCHIFARNRLQYWRNETINMKFNYTVWLEICRNFWHRINFWSKILGM